MQSQVDIANSALIQLGARTINSFLDDTEEARTVRASWTLVTTRLLRRANWAFAIKASPPLSTISGATGYDHPYVYGLPSDYLRLITFKSHVGGYSPASYVAEDIPAYEEINYNSALCLACSIPAPIVMRYVANVQDTTVWDAHFDTLVALDLARVCSQRLSSNRSFTADLYALEQDAMREAIRVGAVTRTVRKLGQGSWVTTRDTTI